VISAQTSRLFADLLWNLPTLFVNLMHPLAKRPVYFAGDQKPDDYEEEF